MAAQPKSLICLSASSQVFHLHQRKQEAVQPGQQEEAVQPGQQEAVQPGQQEEAVQPGQQEEAVQHRQAVQPGQQEEAEHRQAVQPLWLRLEAAVQQLGLGLEAAVQQLASVQQLGLEAAEQLGLEAAVQQLGLEAAVQQAIAPPSGLWTIPQSSSSPHHHAANRTACVPSAKQSGCFPCCLGVALQPCLAALPAEHSSSAASSHLGLCRLPRGIWGFLSTPLVLS